MMVVVMMVNDAAANDNDDDDDDPQLHNKSSSNDDVFDDIITEMMKILLSFISGFCLMGCFFLLYFRAYNCPVLSHNIVSISFFSFYRHAQQC